MQFPVQGMTLTNVLPLVGRLVHAKLIHTICPHFEILAPRGVLKSIRKHVQSLLW